MDKGIDIREIPIRFLIKTKIMETSANEPTTGKFTKDAKQIIDTLFETKYFRDDIKRDEMDAVEDLIDFMLDSRFTSYVRARELVKGYHKKT